MRWIFGKKEEPINLTEELIVRIERKLVRMKELLIQNNYHDHTIRIDMIIEAMQQNNTHAFKRRILSAELLGGSGSVIDCDLGSDDKEFRKVFDEFLGLVVLSGLDNKAIHSSRRILNL